MARYVFPDGELIEVGSVVTELQSVGFEARHVEDLREHYALTLRAWVTNLESHWDEAVRLVGRGPGPHLAPLPGGLRGQLRGRRHPIHQVLAVKPDGGDAGMPLRPNWDRLPLRRTGSSGGEVLVLP